MLDPRVRQRQRLRNTVQGILLLAALVAVAAGLAWLLFGLGGLLWIVLLAAVVGLLRPRIPARTMLSLYGARPLPEAAAPQLHRIVRVLAERAGLLAAPALYYVPLRPAQFSTTSTPSSRSARPSANDARARQTTWNP